MKKNEIIPRQLTESAKTEGSSTVIVKDKFLNTPEELTIPIIFEKKTYVNQAGHIIPAFITPAPKDPGRTHKNSNPLYTSTERINKTDDAMVSQNLQNTSPTNSMPSELESTVLPLQKQFQIAQNFKSNPISDGDFTLLNFSTDDSGNADRFSAKFGDILRYNYETSRFLLWNGKFWENTNQLLIKKMCEKVMKAYRKAAEHLKNSRSFEDSEIYRHSRTSCNNTRLNALIEMLKERFSVSNKIFDTHNNLINVRNGIVDLQNGFVFPHDKNLFFTTFCDTDYIPDRHISDSVFANFLSTVCCHDIQLMNFLQLCFGYAITGETKEQKLFILHGTGSNGKTTLLEAINNVVSSYAKHLSVEVLTGISDNCSGAKPSPELAQTPNVRMLFTSEPNYGVYLNEGLIKLLTGGGTISVRQLYGTPFEFTPKFKIFIDTNHLPQIKDSEYAIQRRFTIIPFNATFKGTSVDRFLPEKLKSQREKESILSWLVSGSIRYYREGLSEPTTVSAATTEYIQSHNSVDRFLSQCVKEKIGNCCSATSLYEAYQNFCDENYLEPLTQTTFGRNLHNHGFTKKRIATGYVYENLCITYA